MARSKPERLWIAGGAVAAVIVAAVGWGFAVSPKLSQADDLRTQTADTQMQNLSLESHVGQLRSDYAKLDQLRKQRDAARLALPTDSGLAGLTEQLNAQGRAAHVSVTLISAGTPEQPTMAASTTPADTSSASSSASSSAAPAPTTSSAAAAGLYSIPINLSVTGARDNDLRFLDLVQHKGPRASLVGSVQLTDSGASATGGGAVTTTMTVTMNVFVETVPSAAPATPTPSPVSTAVAAAN